MPIISNISLLRGAYCALAEIIIACVSSEVHRGDVQLIQLRESAVNQLSALVARSGVPQNLPLPSSGVACQGTPVQTVAELQSAIETSQPGDVIALSEGLYELPASLTPKSGTTLCGQGAGQTIVRAASSWRPDTALLPRTETPSAYLFVIDQRHDVALRDMSLQGPRLHGAIYGAQSKRLTIAGLEIKDFLWSGVRTVRMSEMKVHDNTFIDAGGRIKNTTGGAMYDHYPQECKVWNNRVYESGKNNRDFFGFKGRGGKNCRFHNNDVRTVFAIEYPFDNNVGFEIDHNYLEGTISIPKFGGGRALKGNVLSFHIHHNVLRKSYAIEFARNNVRINHNLFDLDPNDSGGNLISNHSRQDSPGPLWMHDNLINNVGRGIFWSKGVYNRINFVNNHVRALQGKRQSPFFQINPGTDFKTLRIIDNIFEAAPDYPRALLNVDGSSYHDIQNNQFQNVLGIEYKGLPGSERRVGLQKPLQFKAGVKNEIQVNQWSVNGIRL